MELAELVTKFEELSRRVDELVAERDEARRERDEARRERDEYRSLYLDLLERFRKLELGLLGQKSERVSGDDSQLTLGILSEVLAEPAEVPEDQDVRGHKRVKPTGRKPLPENLPRIEVELVPDEVKQKGLEHFDIIGQEVRETVERRPSSMVVVRVTRPKFAPKDRNEQDQAKIVIEPSVDIPIARGLAGPGLLADTIVRRWQDHMPLHRLEKMYGREGLPLARSTMCEWHGRLSQTLAPLLDAMWEDARGSPYLCVDATGVLVQAKERCRHGHFWVAVAPERHVLYGYSARHDSAAVDRMLGGYEGYLVADAHSVYDHLYVDGACLEVGCWAHSRRYFFKALEHDPERATEALALIRALFQLERQFAGWTPKRRKRERQRQSGPIVDLFESWCDEHERTCVGDTPIARAIQYARNQRTALRRFLEDGRLPLHNNISELHLRRQAVGRKNWLFVGNDEAGDVNATFVSLLASCEMHSVEPFSYIRDLLILVNDWRRKDVLELAPVNWAETSARDEVREFLEANIFRSLATK